MNGQRGRDERLRCLGIDLEEDKMAITAAMVKDLREKTGAGMMDCKKALVAVDGDMEKAVDFLREKGMAKAAKKAGRVTSEGLVCAVASKDGKTVALASLQCETDFVSRGEDFQVFANKVASTVLEKKPADVVALERLLGAELTALIAKVGENMKIGQFTRHVAEDTETIGRYIHSNGKLGVLVDLVCGKPETAESEAVQTLGKEIAMQVAALKPMALNRACLDPATIEREREVYREKARNDGKPEKIIEKIAEGAVSKFCKEVCLMDQAYIRDDKKSIDQLVKEVSKSVGDTITVKGYTRIELTSEEK